MATGQTVRVLVVDGDWLARRDLIERFRHVPDLELAALTGSADEAIQRAQRHRPDVVLMDLTLPGGRAFEAAERILQPCPRTRFVFPDAAARDRKVYEVLRVGDAGYWTRRAASADITGAVRAAGRGQTSVHKVVDLVRLAKSGRTAGRITRKTPRTGGGCRCLPTLAWEFFPKCPQVLEEAAWTCSTAL